MFQKQYPKIYLILRILFILLRNGADCDIVEACGNKTLCVLLKYQCGVKNSVLNHISSSLSKIQPSMRSQRVCSRNLEFDTQLGIQGKL